MTQPAKFPLWDKFINEIAQVGKFIRPPQKQPQLPDKELDPVRYYLMDFPKQPEKVPYFQQKLPSNPNLTKGDFWLGLLALGVTTAGVVGLIFIDSKKKRSLFPNYIKSIETPQLNTEGYTILKEKVGLPIQYLNYIKIISLNSHSKGHIWKIFNTKHDISNWDSHRINNELNDFTLAMVAHSFPYNFLTPSEKTNKLQFAIISENTRHFPRELKKVIGNYNYYSLSQYQSVKPNDIILLDANLLIGYNTPKSSTQTALVNSCFEFAIQNHNPIWLLSQILAEINF